MLRVFDVGVGETLANFEAPPGVIITGGALTPDGRFYLAATNLGVVRFTTTPPAIDRVLQAPGPVTSLVVTPTGTTVHIFGAFGRAVVDWESGALISSQCCARPLVSFTPDGSRRLEFVFSGANVPSDATATAIDTATESILWSRQVPAFAGGLATSASHLAFNAGGQATVLDAATGNEVARLSHTLDGMRWRGDAIVGFRGERLASYRLPALAETVILEAPVTPSQRTGLFLSSDGNYAYWLRYISILGISVSSTSYDVVDLDAGRVVARGELGYQSQSDLTLENASQCIFEAPAGLTAPAQGGVVDVPVMPTPNCRPWMARGAMNPGPHTGPAVIGLPFAPSTWSQPNAEVHRIGGALVTITQDAAPPAAPTLRGSVEGNRVNLAWEPGIGAGITGFEIRGAVAGSPMATVLVTQGSAREWTTPALGPGSYVVQLAARNPAGTGPPSNEFRFSIGVTTLPEPPVGLQAAVVDDQVTLAWSPSPTGPAPAGYVVEAAPAGSTSFASVARTSDTSLRVTRAPAGNWLVRVRAVTAGGPGAPSAEVPVTPSSCTAPPSAPQSPWTVFTFPSFTLQWLPPAAGSVDHYLVEVGSVAGRSDIGTVRVSGDRTAIVVSPGGYANPAVARIRAVNACGESAPTSDVRVQLP